MVFRGQCGEPPLIVEERWVRYDEQAWRAFGGDSKSMLVVPGVPDFDDIELDAQGFRGAACGLHLAGARGMIYLCQHRNVSSPRKHVFEQRDALSADLVGDHHDASDISAWPGKASDKTTPDVSHLTHYPPNRNPVGRLFPVLPVR